MSLAMGTKILMAEEHPINTAAATILTKTYVLGLESD